MSEEACLEALDSYGGAVVATHARSQRMAPRARLLSDQVIEGIVARGGVIGVLPLNWALDSSWQASDGKDAVTLDAVVEAIDIVCQIAGDAAHVGLGTDFDGGQGAEAAPAELDTIADLPKLASTLAARGFADADIAAVMGGNWLGFLRRTGAKRDSPPTDPASLLDGLFPDADPGAALPPWERDELEQEPSTQKERR